MMSRIAKRPSEMQRQPMDVTSAIHQFLLKMKTNHHRPETRLKVRPNKHNNEAMASTKTMKKSAIGIPAVGSSTLMTAKKLQSLTKQELMEMCRERNMNCYGTKFDMVQRLLSSDKTGILKEIKHSIPAIRLYKDDASEMYVHRESGLVVDPLEKRVVGRRDAHGNLVGLSYKDIQTCLRYKFRYVLPSNLTETKMSFPSSTSNELSSDSTDGSSREDERFEQRLEEIAQGIANDPLEEEDEEQDPDL